MSGTGSPGSFSSSSLASVSHSVINPHSIQLNKAQVSEHAPTPRFGHTLISTTKSRVFSFFGFTGGFCSSEVLISSDNGANWTVADVSYSFSRPEGRCRHASVSIIDPMTGHCKQILVFGGIDNNGRYLNDLWTFDTYSFEWKKIQSKGGCEVPPKAGMAMAYVYNSSNNSSNLFLFGGWTVLDGFPKLTDDLYIFDLKNKIWKNGKVISKGACPPACAYHSAVTFGTDIILLPGLDNILSKNQHLADSFDPSLTFANWTNLRVLHTDSSTFELLAISGDPIRARASYAVSHPFVSGRPELALISGGWFARCRFMADAHVINLITGQCTAVRFPRYPPVMVEAEGLTMCSLLQKDKKTEEKEKVERQQQLLEGIDAHEMEQIASVLIFGGRGGLKGLVQPQMCTLEFSLPISASAMDRQTPASLSASGLSSPPLRAVKKPGPLIASAANTPSSPSPARSAVSSPSPMSPRTRPVSSSSSLKSVSVASMGNGIVYEQLAQPAKSMSQEELEYFATQSDRMSPGMECFSRRTVATVKKPDFKHKRPVQVVAPIISTDELLHATKTGSALLSGSPAAAAVSQQSSRQKKLELLFKSDPEKYEAIIMQEEQEEEREREWSEHRLDVLSTPRGGISPQRSRLAASSSAFATMHTFSWRPSGRQSPSSSPERSRFAVASPPPEIPIPVLPVVIAQEQEPAVKTGGWKTVKTKLVDEKKKEKEEMERQLMEQMMAQQASKVQLASEDRFLSVFNSFAVSARK